MADRKPPKVFDIAKPGKSAPSASAKPIVVTNRPVLKDPMVTTSKETPKETTLKAASRIRIEPIHHDDDQPAPVAAKKAKATKSSADTELPIKISLAPLPAAEPTPDVAEPAAAPHPTEVATPAEAEEPPETPKTAEPTAADKPTEPTPEPEPEPEKPTPESPKATGPPPSVGSQPPIKDGTKETNADLVAQKEQERAAEVQKIVDSRRYYLPINQVEKRRNRRAIWLGVVVVILLGGLWLDVALDARLISIPGVHAPTHFFSK